ncbi:WD-40 repeat protein [Reticulomyxa filosa]|uniref:WD-40 repeat protein n=1 Tax=Reticulomyxa filosa TaxID=46433 RepID=X6MZE5_RETFI|nr:WD-40 repeat protein [Reticulomyxa filosa]|eukprot:ETO19380.1 WD-40 repeat protein [Reticulomyxa filosa]
MNRERKTLQRSKKRKSQKLWNIGFDYIQLIWDGLLNLTKLWCNMFSTIICIETIFSHIKRKKNKQTKSVRLLKVFDGHSDYVKNVKFSPDGTKVISSSYDGSSRIWDVASGNVIQKILCSYWIFDAQFSPDGNIIALHTVNKTFGLWDVNSGLQIRVFEGHMSKVSSIHFSPDGQTIVSSSWDATIRLWDVKSGQEIKRFEGNSVINDAEFSPDGLKIVSCSSDRKINIQILIGHEMGVTDVRFSHDDKIIASCSYDKTIRLWDVKSGKEIQQLKGHTAYVRALDFSPNGNTIVSASNDKTVRFWG